MARPRIRAGEIGTIQITHLAKGKYRTRARTRDDAGTLYQLVVAETEELARQDLDKKMFGLSAGSSPGLTRNDTVADAAKAWLEHVHTRATVGSLSSSTYENYEISVRCTLLPRCGGIALGALTVGRCDRIIQAILLERSISAARRARRVFNMICAFVVCDDAIPFNPVRDVQRLPLPPKKTSILTPEQIAGIRKLMSHWQEIRKRGGPRADFRALIDDMDIMLGTSGRIGERLALRRRDVDMTANPPTLSINGTNIDHRGKGTSRKDSPKRTRQIRRVALPVMAATAVRSRLSLAVSGPDALLFPTRTGALFSVHNYERLLRSFIDENREALLKLDVEVDEYSTHIYRRTVATLIERNAGITLASRLLGHANEQISRASYVVSQEQVDPVTVDILDTVLGK